MNNTSIRQSWRRHGTFEPVRKTRIQQQTNRYQRKLAAAKKARRKHTRELHRRERRRK